MAAQGRNVGAIDGAWVVGPVDGAGVGEVVVFRVGARVVGDRVTGEAVVGDLVGLFVVGL